jgi:hypothetical protein
MNNCLIIAFYSGNRDGYQNKDYQNYLNIHTNLYEKILNNIKKIYFVISVDNLEKEYFEDYKNNSKISFYFRKNKNLSFGSWVDIINLTNHDYYFLCEDDYFFIKDNFDNKLINEYNEYKSDYHVLWRKCKMSNGNIDYNGTFKGEEICTIGVISKQKSELVKDYNNIDYGHKCSSMSTFLTKFNSISYCRNVIFPYYDHRDDSISLYIDDHSPIHSKKNPTKFNEVLNYDLNDERSPILCCYQYLNLYKKI